MEISKKAKKYNKIKFKFKIIFILFIFLFYLLFFITNFSAFFADLAKSITSSYFLALNIYLLIFISLEEIISLPLSFYSEFIVEHKYDHSNETLGGFFADEIKSLIIKLILISILINIIYAVIKISPQHWWIYATIVSIVIFTLLSFLLPKIIIPLFFKLTPLDNKSLLKTLNKLCTKSNIKLLGLYSINLSKKTKAGNAAFVGLGSTKKIILGDNILDRYTSDEIETIIGHEIAHYLNKDQIKLLIIQSLFFALTFYLIYIIMTTNLAFFHLENLYDFAGLPIFLIISFFISLILLPGTTFLIRSMEFKADKKALELVPKPEALSSALKKLTKQNLGEFDPHPLKEFIFHSHPSIKKRVKKIEN